MKKKNKNKKLNGIVIKSFIVIAVLMMLISVIPSQAEINEKNKNGLGKEVVSEDNAIVECSEPSDLNEMKSLEDTRDITLTEREESLDLLDANANTPPSTPYHQPQNIKSSSETEKSAKSPDQGSISNDTYNEFNTTGRTLNNVTITNDGYVNLTNKTIWSDDFETDKGWTTDGTSPVLWARGDPVGDTYQQEDDHTPAPGVNCQVTGVGASTWVDGTANLYSPLIDLSSTTDPYLCYWRDILSADVGDSATFYVCSDGNLPAPTWVTLETITVNDAVWIQKSWRIASYVSLTANFKFRVLMTEGAAAGPCNGMLDDVGIYEGGLSVYPTAGNITSATTTVSGNIGSAKVSWNASDTGNYSTTKEYSGTSTSGLNRPFESAITQQRWQCLYLQSNIGQYGVIDKLYLKVFNSGAGTFGGTYFAINLGHTTSATLSTSLESNFNVDGKTEVYNVTSYSIASYASSTWIGFDVNNLFTYNNNGNLIFEIIWVGTASGYDSNAIQETVTGSMMYDDGNDGTGVSSDSRMHCKFDILTPSFNVSVSNNDGTNWADVSAKNNTWHTFTYSGTQLKYRVYFYGNGSGTAKLDNIQIVYNYTVGANQTPTATNLGVQGYTSSPGILNITNHTPVFNYTYTDPESDNQFRRNVTVYNITGGKLIWYANYTDSKTSGTNVTVTFNNDSTATVALLDGCEYYFNVTCNDTGSNNWSAVASVKFHMNSLPTTTLSAPANNTWTNDSTPLFDWDYSDAEGISQYAFNLTISNSSTFSIINYSANVTTSNTYYDWPTALPDGTWYWQVKTFDSYEWGDWSGWRIIKIDTALPTSTISTPSADPAYYNTTPIWLNGTCSDLGTVQSGINKVEINITWKDNGTTYLAWTNVNLAANYTWWNYSFTPPNEANFTIKIRAIDNASNYQVAITRNVTYDITNPTSLVNAISPYWNTTGTIIITVTSSDAISGIDNVSLWWRYSTNNASWGAWTYHGYDDTPPYSFTFVSATKNGDGYYQFYSIGKDNASNIEAAPGDPGDAMAGVDTTKPELSSVQDTPDPQEVNGWVNITVFVKDNVNVNAVKVNITRDGALVGNFSMTGINLDANNNGTYYYNTTYSTLGTYTYFIWANDTSDNRNTSAALGTFTFIITSANNPPNPPILTSPDNNTWTNDNTPLFDWDFSDPEGDESRGYNVTISNSSTFTTINYWVNKSTVTNITEHTWGSGGESSSPIADGTWYWRVKANDTSGVWSDWSGWRIIKIDTAAPTVTAVSPAQGATNIAITTTITKTFNEPMNQTSVEASFKVYQDGSATNLSGTYSWSGNECIFTPSSQLSPNTKYWGNVSIGAKDLAGNPLGVANNTWFTTAAGVGITVNSPSAAGIAWQGGSSKWINYTISGGTAPYTVKLYYSTADTTGTMYFIAYDNRSATGTFNYTWNPIPSVNSMNCYVNISMNDSTTSGYDLSNSAFTIDSTVNVPPIADFVYYEGIHVADNDTVNVTLRVSGTKYKTVNMTIISDDNSVVSSVSITREAGCPDNKTLSILVDSSQIYIIVLDYTADEKGGNPVWVTINYRNISNKMHLVFNANKNETQIRTFNLTETLDMMIRGVCLIKFESVSYDPDGNITNYEWVFDDGYTSTSMVVYHYYTVGNHTVGLTVTDNNGASGVVYKNFTVLDAVEYYSQYRGLVGVVLDCPADLLITDKYGSKIGFENGEIVNFVPNATVIVCGDIEIYILPRNTDYYYSIAGVGSGKYKFAVFDPGEFGPGEFDPGEFGPGEFGPGEFGKYDPGEFGPGEFAGKTYVIESDISVATIDGLVINMDAGVLNITSNENKFYSLYITNATDMFTAIDMGISGDTTHSYTVKNWSKIGTSEFSVELGVDDNNDGIIDFRVDLFTGTSGEIITRVKNATVNGHDVNVVYHGPATLSIGSAPPTAPPKGVSSIGIFIDISGAATNVFITIKYKDSDVSDIDESKLRMYYWNGTRNEWVLIEDSGVWENNNTVWANVDHLTIFAPMAEKTAAGKKVAPISLLSYIIIFAIAIVLISAGIGVKKIKKKKPATVRCKKCGETIDVKTVERPTEVVCPRCDAKETLK